MSRKTTIASNLTHTTKFIDPASGQVLREGTTPMATVGEFKAQGSNVEQPKEDVVTREEFNELKGGIDEIKNLLKNK